jgi:hypothetical protein
MVAAVAVDATIRFIIVRLDRRLGGFGADSSEA